MIDVAAAMKLEQGNGGHVADADAVAPGWHSDPMGQHDWRYWDGAIWTEHVSDVGRTPQPAPVAPSSTPHAVLPSVSLPSVTLPSVTLPSVSLPSVVAGLSKAASGRARTSAVVALVGGVLMALGAILPWEVVTVNGAIAESVKGLSEGAGGLTLGAGLLVGLLAVLFLNGTLGRGSAIAMVSITAVALVFVMGNFMAISNDIDQAAGAGVDGFVAVDATLGMGIVLAILGGLVAIAASIMVLLSRDARAAAI